jgi:hypothetical protein
MTGLVFSLLASALLSSGHAAAPAPTPLPAGEWTFNGNAASACELTSDGRATDKLGAQLEVQCDQDAQIFGNVVAKLPADYLQQRRVTITAEVRAGAGMEASLWLKTAHNASTLMFENDTEQTLLNAASDDGWAQRSISLPVAADATAVSFGVLLQGSGAVAVRNLRVTVSQAGAVSTTAQAVLEAALNIVKKQTAARSDIAWRVLETEVRVLASGAQETAEVYPAIKYLLTQLGDRRSLLLTPELAAAFDRGNNTPASASSISTIKIFSLPDGANLVLSAITTDLDPRIARNFPTANGETASP